MPVERAPGGTSLIDVLDRILDKGIIIDAWVRISLAGIDLAIPLALVDDPIVAVLRGGLPERIRDATSDERISPEVRNTLAKARLGPIVAAPLRSAAGGGQARHDAKGSATPGWEHRGEW